MSGHRAGLRIVVHDYAGHPFQVQLSRALASRGHVVLHLHFAGLQTPKGRVERRVDDPTTFVIDGLDIGEPFEKHRFVRRLRQERRYGRLLADRIAAFHPDVVISANSPLDVQAAALGAARRLGAGFIFWIQDLYSVAVERTLRRKLWLLGGLIARRFVHLERSVLRRSDVVVAITDDFVPILTRWGVSPDRVLVIENWAPLDEIQPVSKDNPWAHEHGLASMRVILYSGTLGLKHDPSLLLRLADAFRRESDVRVVVISEGLGADWLSDRTAGRPNLMVLPFQPFERLSEVIGSGDVTIAILEPEAGVYSVPSKVLTYLAAGRPILAAMPAKNLAARIITRVGAGPVVEPGDGGAFVAAARALLANPEARQAASEQGRAFAVTHFAIDTIVERFEPLLIRAAASGSAAAGKENRGVSRSAAGR